MSGSCGTASALLTFKLPVRLCSGPIRNLMPSTDQSMPQANSSSSRRTLIALSCVIAATLVCFHRLTLEPTGVLVGPQREGHNDLTGFFIPARDYPRLARDKFGELPSWNPHSLGGTPLLGNPQSAFFYPPNWLYLWLPAALAASWLLVFHHFWAGWGTYLVCRRYGFSEIAAVTGAVVMLAAPFMLAQTGEGHYNQICVVSWIPWAFLAFERWRENKPFGTAIMAGVLALGFFCGHAQELYYLILSLSAFVVVDVLQRFRVGELREGVHMLRRWCLVGAGCGGLVAVELLPNLFYIFLGVRSGGFSAADVGGTQATQLAQLLNPWVLGGPESYLQPPFWETLCHFGIAPLLLMVCALALGWSYYPVRRMSILWLIALAFSFGSSSLLFLALHSFVPGINLFRAPGRVMFLASFAIAVLAAAGVHLVAQQAGAENAVRLRVKRRFAFGLAITLGGFVLSMTALHQPLGDPWASADSQAIHLDAPPSETGIWSATLGRPTTWATLSAGFIGALAMLRWPGSKFAASFAVLCLLELSLFGNQVLQTVPKQAQRLDNPIIKLLQKDDGLSRVVAQQQLLSDREAWQHGLYKVQSYEPVPLLRWVLAVQAMTSDDPSSAVLGYDPIDLTAFRKSVVDMLGVRYAVVVPHRKASLPGWELLERDRIVQEFTLNGSEPRRLPYAVYENQTVLPRAYIVGKARELGTADLVKTLVEIDPRQEVLIPKDVLPAGTRAEFQAANIVEYSPHRVVIEATLKAPGYLFLSDLYYPGWTATDNTISTQIIPANLAFRAVPLAAGRHQVVFRYRPPGLRIGATVSLCTFLLLGVGSFRRRKQAPADA